MAMIPGQLSPLQITAAAGLLQNTGLATNPKLTAIVAQYQSLPLIANFLAVLNNAVSAELSPETIQALYELGDSVCPALADTIPSDYREDPPFIGPDPESEEAPLVTIQSNFTSLLVSVTDGYVDSTSKFAQAFAAAEGYITLANLFIESNNNANNYLGPTFSNMNNLITADVTKVTTLPDLLASDLVELGELINLGDLEHLGEPATLIQQLNTVANISEGTVPCLETALRVVGLSSQDINDLVTNNRQSLFNPNGLTENEFARLQQQAYRALTLVRDACLIDVLDLLGVTKPGIDDMADLLDPEIILSNSYLFLKYNDQPIYIPNGPVPDGLADSLPDGTPNVLPSSLSNIFPNGIPPGFPASLPRGASINNNLLIAETAPTGCDELGKIIPRSTAVANKALQFSLQQISGIQNLTLPEFAALIA